MIALPQWAGSDRRERLPANWGQIRKRILRRDGFRCTALSSRTGERCSEYATDVDHIIAGDDHRESNLRSLCGACHQKKSSGEGKAAQVAQWKKNNAKFRRTERHPGSL